MPVVRLAEAVTIAVGGLAPYGVGAIADAPLPVLMEVGRLRSCSVRVVVGCIITSFPGLGEVTGARLLGEIGDDRDRFAEARALKAYAGSAPVTRSSGRHHAVVHRRIKNQRIAAVGYVWAFAALTASTGARAHYDRRKDRGDRHPAALRNLFNRFIGCLFHCLQTGQTYHEHAAFPARNGEPTTA